MSRRTTADSCGPTLTSRLGGLTLAAAMLGAVLSAAPAAAAETPIPHTIAAFEDRKAQLTAADIADRFGDFRPLIAGRLDAGFSRSAHWLLVEIPSIADGSRRVIVEIGSPVLDRVEGYRRDAGTWRRIGVAGDGIVWSARAYPHRMPAFMLEPGTSGTSLLIRITSEGTLNAPIRVWHEAEFLASSGADDLFYGIYFGFLAAMLAYNLFLWGAVRDASYLWYVAYIAALALLQGKLSGYADRFFWPEMPALANPVNLLGVGAVLAAGAQFTKAFLGGAAAGMRRPIAVVQFGIVGAAALLPISYALAMQAMLGLGLAVIVVLVAAMIRAFRSGYRPARFILIAFAALALGAIALILRALGIVGPEVPADRIFDSATALEAVLLSFALADRINAIEAERRRAEAALGTMERRFSAALLEAQERERQRLAAELHDAIGQNLVVVGNRLRALESASGSGAPAVKDLADISRETLDQVRGIARGLHPAEIDRLGLMRALAMMATRAVEGSGISLEAHLGEKDPQLVPERRIQLYRLAQEAVTNAVKHSGARRLMLGLERAGGRATLVVADDGVGFDAASVEDSLGLITMRQRASLLGGTFTLDTGAGRGTRIGVSFPEGPT